MDFGFSMKKTFLLCLASAVGGAGLSAILFGPFDSQNRLAAQDPVAPQFPVQEQPSPPALPVLPPARRTEAAVPTGLMPPRGDTDDLTPEERVNVAVYASTNRGVVNITTRGYRGESLWLMGEPSEGEGSGSVIDREGHILTNNHVVEGSQEIEVTLFNTKGYQAQIVGQDATTDVAVLKIKAPPEELFPVTFGDSGRLRIGQRVFAIGNPFGLQRTLSTGIVSNLDQPLPRRHRAGNMQMIQIDAAINPGIQAVRCSTAAVG